MNHVHLQDHVLIHEIRQGRLIGNNPPYLGRRQEHILRLFRRKKRLYGLLPRQIQFLVRAQHQIRISLPLQFPHNGRSHHPAVPGHIDFTVLFHFSPPSENEGKVCVPSSYRAAP